ncbi:uncharacterized protein PG998_012352 [Apiospora kogelbergensis]|uniref:Uncharacterized protein n=1 Tax=Apiospora kogelbergensis TaxID=1337665 RepID=A0AAW0QP59_9PEZI
MCCFAVRAIGGLALEGLFVCGAGNVSAGSGLTGVVFCAEIGVFADLPDVRDAGLELDRGFDCGRDLGDFDEAGEGDEGGGANTNVVLAFPMDAVVLLVSLVSVVVLNLAATGL